MYMLAIHKRMHINNGLNYFTSPNCPIYWTESNENFEECMPQLKTAAAVKARRECATIYTRYLKMF